METIVYEPEIVEFCENLSLLKGIVAISRVYGVEIMFDKVRLEGDIEGFIYRDS